MRTQLIFCVECNEKSKSDWIYINETIKHYYNIDYSMVKLTTVYMDGKGNYNSNKKKKEIDLKIKQYRAGSKEKSKSIVIYAFDTDEYMSNPCDKEFMKDAQKYCNQNNYELIWFCKDIEQVYWGKQMEKSDKTKEARRFAKNKMIEHFDDNKLRALRMSEGKSNLFDVLNKLI